MLQRNDFVWKGWLLFFLVGLAPVVQGQRGRFETNEPIVPEGYVESTREVEPAGSVWDRLLFGGDLGLMFGNVTHINLAPAVAYDVTEDQMFVVGGGPVYQYTNWVGYAGDSHMFGLRNFAMLTLFDFLLVMGQYEWLNYNFQADPTRLNSHALFLGGGYALHFDKGFYYFALLYNVLPRGNESPYYFPFDFRTGIFF